MTRPSTTSYPGVVIITGKPIADNESGVKAGGPGEGDIPVGADLPLLHRIAVVYLMAPLGVWLLGWFEWWFGVPAVALIVLALRQALSGSWRVSVTPVALVLPSIALTWVMLNPAGGLFASLTGDWGTHRAVLFELWRGSWPVRLMDWPSGDPPLLRYYLGYYMIPGVIGKWFGPAALNWAVPAWTWGGVALIMLLFARGLPTPKAALAATAVLVFFDGMGIVQRLAHGASPPALENSLEMWKSLLSFTAMMGNQSLALTFYHTPQHFIGGGLVALLLIQLRRHPRFLYVSGIVVSACLFWSSLLSIGLLPLIGALIFRNRVRAFLTWQNLIVAPALAALLALYLTAGGVRSSVSFLWQGYGGGSWDRMLGDVLLLYSSEFLILALLLYWMDRRIVRDPFIIAALAVLSIAPWFNWQDGEFAKRFVVPAQFVLAFWTARVAVERLSEHRKTASDTITDRSPPRAALVLLIGVLCTGALDGLFIVGRQVSEPAVVDHYWYGAPLKIKPESIIDQRSTATIPDLLRTLLRDKDGE